MIPSTAKRIAFSEKYINYPTYGASVSTGKEALLKDEKWILKKVDNS